MILGIGIDIIDVERVAEKIAKGNGFLQKVFHPEEIRYCENLPNGDQHFAVRFAAKEAFLKATGQGLLLGFELNQIEVVNLDSGKPEIRLSGNFRKLARENGWNKIHLSLSHVQATACAMVIIEQ